VDWAGDEAIDISVVMKAGAMTELVKDFRLSVTPRTLSDRLLELGDVRIAYIGYMTPAERRMTPPAKSRHEHFLDRAEAAMRPGWPGVKRQAGLRRTMSDAYHAACHALVTAAADAVAGKRAGGSGRHGLVCRSIDHRATCELCQTGSAGDAVAEIPAAYAFQRVRPGDSGSR
jgi:hypothetical protein